MTTVGAVRRPEAWSFRRSAAAQVAPDSVGERLREQFPPRSSPDTWPEDRLDRADLEQLLLDERYLGTTKATSNSRRRGLVKVLDWLAAQPGDSWQARWSNSGVQALPAGRWHSVPIAWSVDLDRHDRHDLSSGLHVMLAAGVIRPGYRWMLGRQHAQLVQLLAESRDPDGIAHLRAVLAQRPDCDPGGRHGVLGRIAIIIVTKGGLVRDITVGDCRELWELRTKHRASAARHHFYDLLRAAGFLPANAPQYLRMFLPPGQLTVEEMIDRYRLRCEPVRDLLVDYLRERQPVLDYSTLVNVASTLGRMFWRDLEHHHPGIDSLHLADDVLDAWKQRVMVKTRTISTADGEVIHERSPRAGAKEKLHIVRAFYLDIGQWALEDPRWAAWVAPCPIRPRDVDQAKDKKHRKSRIDQRIRERLPVLPTLVRTVDQCRKRAARTLEQAQLTEPGHYVTVDGEPWLRPRLAHGFADKIWIEHPDTGRRRDLTREGHEAFWGWAIVEVLRHTGIRVEELLELSHHSFVQYRLPTTGELVPLLQIAPSKTDAERLLLISPELADVLSTIVHRVQGPDGKIPAVVAYDRGERVWNPAMPLLFQRAYSNENRPMNGNYVRERLNDAVAHSGLTDAEGLLLRFTPHDFRRLFVTDAILNGLPPHIAQVICGHADIGTTMGYKAVYPEEAIAAHRAFIARRRQTRPGEEYRAISDDEWDEFLAHFEKRKVSLGTCGRAFATPCIHEHSCIRCPVLRPNPAQRERLVEIRDNLIDRINEATREGWLGEVEGLQVSLAGADDKLTQIDASSRPVSQPIHLGLSTVGPTIDT